MPVIIRSQLNSIQKTQIQSIIDAAYTFEPVTITFPMDDADFYVFFETEGVIRSAAAFSMEDDDTCGCCAYTAPKYRKQGMFSEILETAIDELPEDTQFLFYTDHKSKDTLTVLSSLEAECVMDEHMMEIDAASISQLTENLSPNMQSGLQMTESVFDGTHTFSYSDVFGSVRISVFSSYYYLYGFEIAENHRQKGHGTKLLLQVLKDLSNRKNMPVRLQVSGTNIPAMRLYNKTGFRITETLSCYIY
ncbi:MAG: GNAT family N-acetyltransferase [Lachnospiraceae bacterium]|nr:GNAT family N-acetyltransferase [Lachnospiraceae bacterium]